jgi:opine dehydrogenase
VAEVLAEADAERLRIGRAYGVASESLCEWIATAYGHRADSILTAVGGNPAYVGIKAPTTLDHRYLTEDVPTGLSPLLDFGRAAGVPVPTLRKLVDLAISALGAGRLRGARTLASLGLDGLSPSRIFALLVHGSPGHVVPVAHPAPVSYRTKPVADIPTTSYGV